MRDQVIIGAFQQIDGRMAQSVERFLNEKESL